MGKIKYVTMRVGGKTPLSEHIKKKPAQTELNKLRRMGIKKVYIKKLKRR